MHGNSRDVEAVAPYDPPILGVEPDSTVNAALNGTPGPVLLGIVGGTDFHDSKPGMVCHLDGHQTGHMYGGSLTAVFSDQGLTRSAVHQALIDRHTMATSGPMIPAMLRVFDDEGALLARTGEQLHAEADEELVLRVDLPPAASPYVVHTEIFDSEGATRSMTELEAGVFELQLSDLQPPWWGYAVITLEGDAWYADQGVTCDDGGDDDREKLWTSPVWIAPMQGDDDDSTGPQDDDDSVGPQDDDDSGGEADDDTSVVSVEPAGCQSNCRLVGSRVPRAAGLLLAAAGARRVARRRSRWK